MSGQFRLELPVLLPHVDNVADSCVARLVANLSARDGVEKVLIEPAAGKTPAKICIHYDPGQLTLFRIRDIARTEGAAISGRFGHLRWDIDDALGPRRARAIAARLESVPGVVETDTASPDAVRVDYDRLAISEDELRVLLHEVDTTATALPERGQGRMGGSAAVRSDLVFALLCGVFLVLGYGFRTLAGAPVWLATLFSLLAYVTGSWAAVRETAASLLDRRMSIDALVLLAATGAAALGAWTEGALLLFLFALSRWASGRARRHAQSGLGALATRAPRIAMVRREDRTMTVAVEKLAIGDVVTVAPKARIPADGFVIAGSSDVDESPVIGQAGPVEKVAIEEIALTTALFDGVGASHRVYAGTVNGGRAIDVRVTRVAGDTVLAKLVRIAGAAAAQASPTERLETLCVGFALATAAIFIFGAVLLEDPLRDTLSRAIALLVAASPFALALAAPTAVVAAIARGARNGMLMKDATALQALARLRTFALNKTATLTEGHAQVTDVVPAGDVAEADLLRVAMALERLCPDPLGKAIAAHVRGRPGVEPQQLATAILRLPGFGIAGYVDGQSARIGSPAMFSEGNGAPVTPELLAASEIFEDAGRTTLVVRHGHRDLGLIGLMDPPRACTADVIAQLRALGVKRLVILSGDSQRVVRSLAKAFGLDEAWSELRPEEKVSAIGELMEAGPVAMVGDGMNEDAAMARATIGIAGGAAASDAALETADVALLADGMAQLPYAVRLSRQTVRIVRQNLALSLVATAILVPAAIMGAGIVTVTLVQFAAALAVLFNGLRMADRETASSHFGVAAR